MASLEQYNEYFKTINQTAFCEEFKDIVGNAAYNASILNGFFPINKNWEIKIQVALQEYQTRQAERLENICRKPKRIDQEPV